MSVCKNKKAIIKYVSLNKNGTINLEYLKDSMSEKVKAVVISHISNVIGSINPIKEISDIVHKYSAVVIVDGAQSAPHIKIDVRDLHFRLIKCVARQDWEYYMAKWMY